MVDMKYSNYFATNLWPADDAPKAEWVIGFWIDDYGPAVRPSYRDDSGDWWRAKAGDDYRRMPLIEIMPSRTKPEGWKPL